jgi:hypothetical protein
MDDCTVGMKTVWIFSDRIRNRIRLKGFRSVRIRVRIFNIWYRIRIRKLKSYIYDVGIKSYLIWHGWHYPYSNPNPIRITKTNIISVIYVRIRPVFILTAQEAMHGICLLVIYRVMRTDDWLLKEACLGSPALNLLLELLVPLLFARSSSSCRCAHRGCCCCIDRMHGTIATPNKILIWLTLASSQNQQSTILLLLIRGSNGDITLTFTKHARKKDKS